MTAHALAIPPDELDTITKFAAEGEHLTGKRILVQHASGVNPRRMSVTPVVSHTRVFARTGIIRTAPIVTGTRPAAPLSSCTGRSTI